ncbi:MAG TPA: tyrosine-type recombinase/integrase [Chloroflexi bacterium]|jgi:integrase/recombinase XerC|nr:tyrosine-type recombinase/integrase [Chloroflexota bacterium]
MAPSANNQPSPQVEPLSREVAEFVLDRRARNLTPKTLLWYDQSLTIFAAFLEEQGVVTTEAVTPGALRRFLLNLQERGHNPGGVRNIWGAVKAYLRWYGGELAPPDWPNPLRRVETPRTPQVQMEPVPIDSLRAMLATCRRRTFTGDRDRAILLGLLDTGCRASEFRALNLGDVDLGTGAVLVRRGKGRKARSTFLGAKARQALLRYLRHRGELADGAPLWATRGGTRLTYAGLREVVRRRAVRAGVDVPSLHSFRHAFALNALRNGVDLVSLQRLLGHADLSVLRRYLAQTDGDLAAAHRKASPVDRLKL